MNSISSSSHHPSEYSPAMYYSREPELKHAMTSTHDMLEQTPPPTLREILSAYRAKGDGDREMLLAMLSAKAAEDKRLAEYAALRRSLLDVYRESTSIHASEPALRVNGGHYYPTPTFTHSPPLREQRAIHRVHHRGASGSRSPSRSRPYPSIRDHHHYEPSRKRTRISPSPPPTYPHYDSRPPSQPEQLPPSPYSSSERSESAEYSPRARASMAIGSLLSSGPSKDASGDEP
ncbi:hypothetical protein AX16_005644 [Volvariella volvacea WC 439]|nr:hypothetical protein AX16_005644 [Volvariella volvacea WC 439]